jgi:hypothetical protein
VKLLVTSPEGDDLLKARLPLYRNKKECVAHDGAYDKKTELARAMIDVFSGWTSRRIELAADSAYCNDTVTRGLSGRVVLFGSMRPDAVLSTTAALCVELDGDHADTGTRGIWVTSARASAQQRAET